MSYLRCLHLSLFASVTIILTGCSGGPDAVPLPNFDPAGAGAKAMEMYDTDGDGFLDSDELEKAPSLRAAIKNLDTDSDGKVTADEIAERVRVWENMRIGLMSISCEVYLDGQPLDGATVIMEPADFLEGAIKTATGTTFGGGIVRPNVPKEERPSPDSPPGIQAGLFKVKISKKQGGKELIPSKYNVETTLGQEISKDDSSIMNNRVIFRLKSK